MVIASAGAEEILLDEVVAVVNRQAITHSEMLQEAAIAWVDRNGFGASTRGMESDKEFLAEILENLINQRVLLGEASRMGIPTSTEREDSELLTAFRQHFPDEAAFQRFLRENDLDERSIREIFARHLKVERLKKNKLRSLPAITERAVRAYYRKNRLALGLASLDEVAEAIRLKLMTQQREKSLSEWLFELRKRSEVKVLVDVKGEG